MVKNQFFSQTTNTVRFTKKMFSRSRYHFGTSEHFETKMSFVAYVCRKLYQFY